MFEKDDEYVVIDGQVKIVDEQTGRIMEGRRWTPTACISHRSQRRRESGSCHTDLCNDYAAKLLPYVSQSCPV